MRQEAYGQAIDLMAFPVYNVKTIHNHGENDCQSRIF